MVSRTLSNRMKAAAIAALMCLSAAGATVPALYQPVMGVSAAAALNKSLDNGDAYKSTFADFNAADLTSLTITVKSTYTGNFSFGLGVSTDDAPYWLEYDGSGPEWVDTEGGTIEVPGTEVKVTKGEETEITIDLSDIKVNPKGKFEFRNYYSADWSTGKENLVPITLVSITAGGGSSKTDDPGSSSSGSGSALKVGEKLAAGDNYKSFFSEFTFSDAKEMIITVKAPYTGNFSFGLGVSTDDDPYWLEYDGAGPEWVDTEGGEIEVPGTEVKVTKDKETQIVIDLSDITLNPKGKFEFRNYYSADWSTGKENPVEIELVSIEVNGTASAAETTTAATTTTAKTTTTTAAETTAAVTTKPAETTTASTSSGSVLKVGESLENGDAYKSFFSEFQISDAKQMIITVKAPYAGNMSFGLGVSTDEDPYWLEYDGAGPEWVDTEGGEIEVPGTEVKVTKDKETQIVIDLSDITINPKGKFEFRNYYSADWSTGKENLVPIELVSIEVTGAAATTTAATTTTAKATTTTTTTAATTTTAKATTTTAAETTTAATTTTTATATEPAAKPETYGDANGDKTVDILDVIAVNKQLLGVSKLNAQGLANADVNADGSVTSDDALYILKCALEMIQGSEFPIKK